VLPSKNGTNGVPGKVPPGSGTNGTSYCQTIARDDSNINERKKFKQLPYKSSGESVVMVIMIIKMIGLFLKTIQLTCDLVSNYVHSLRFVVECVYRSC